VLEIRDICFTIPHEGGEKNLIDHASLKVDPRHFMAIVGPSGCGKTTLLKLVAGLIEESEGHIFWRGRDLARDEDLAPAELGYVPQFSIAYDHLTVEESISTAVRLRIVTSGADEVERITDAVLEQTGLSPLRERFVRVLSGGQKRRLGLAMELVSAPDLLLCDEVTSGLDPQSERDITELLHRLSRLSERRIVINVTHSLGNLEFYDSILVLHEGRVVFHGPPRALAHYFSVDHAEEVYPQLAQRSAERWAESWDRYRGQYYEKFGIGDGVPGLKDGADTAGGGLDGEVGEAAGESSPAPLPIKANAPEKLSLKRELNTGSEEVEVAERDPDAPDLNERDLESPEEAAAARARTPGILTQFRVLLSRRWRIFLRDKTQLVLHLAMILGFPMLVVIFCYDGIEPPRAFPLTRDGSPQEQVKLVQSISAQHLELGTKLSGLLMFQVVLLTLMGSNNGAREIAAERHILEKEKLGGLHPLAYVASKVAFLTPLVLAQAIWMVFIVELVSGGLPGDLLTKASLMIAATAAMTAVTLGISSMMKTPEQATLLSIYLVGFQLPLSGAVLALPDMLAPVVRPFIAAFWAWSGSLESVKEGSYSIVLQAIDQTGLMPFQIALAVLAFHVFLGLLVALLGSRRSQWE